MTKKIRAKRDTADIVSAFGSEDEFNDSLVKHSEALEYELGVQFRKAEREAETDCGRIDILAEPYGSRSDQIVVESKIGELDDDHISRGHKYAIEQDATVLVYIADRFSSITQRQLSRIGENDDQMFIFALSPSISHSNDESVTMGFTQAVSPSDWEEYRSATFPSGLRMDRVIIFDHLSDELANQDIAELERNKRSPRESGCYETEPDPIGDFDIYYSVRQHVTKEADSGDNIGNITLNIRTDSQRKGQIREFVDMNEEMLDESFKNWNVVSNWNGVATVAINETIEPSDHEQVVEWFVQQRKILSDIQNNLILE
ncbi:hypothetical protein [Halalkalirubrum salinum]|uniref:hypothetical protein n=1 Tax=Halalkalirubrum salinum TaxID=2563889 RepID=UPI0010FB7921|nr:hypothetical protein [Halalkalirubrum salinum]